MTINKTLLSLAGSLALGTALVTSASAADTTTISAELKQSLRTAVLTNNSFVVDAVTQAAKTENPSIAAAIHACAQAEVRRYS